MTSDSIRTVVVLVIAAFAVASDVRTRRIPNVLTVGAAVVAIAFSLIEGGINGTTNALFAWFIGAALFFPFFALGGMGAGDVKLLAALAAWLSPADAVYLALFAAMAGGAIAVVVALLHGYTRQAISNVWMMLMHWRIVGPKPVPGLTLQDGQGPRLAYAIPIAVGVLCTLWRH